MSSGRLQGYRLQANDVTDYTDRLAAHGMQQNPMDELDRIFRRLVQNVRAAYPELLSRSFEVSQIYQQIVPYRHNRRELALDTNEDYELALTKLLSGARGYLTGDDEMQRTLRSELESRNPDLSAYRAFATSTVSLVPEALRLLDAQLALPAMPEYARAMPTSNERTDQAEVAARATELLFTSSASSPAAPEEHLSPVAPQPLPPTPLSAQPQYAGAAKTLGSHNTMEVNPMCRFCGGQLPEGKEVRFCPHCGHDLTVKHCPACNTELEIGWRYCITCGRDNA